METNKMETKQIDEKQLMIIRQSQSKLAQEVLCCKLGPDYSVNALLKASELFTDYVTYGYEAVKERVMAFDTYINKKKINNK